MAALGPLPEGLPENAEQFIGRILQQFALRNIRLIPGTDLIPLGVHTFLGTDRANGEPSTTFAERSGRCFELACWAVVAGWAPESSRLIHGSIHGRDDDMIRIAHAWVVLPGGLIWEPTNALIHDAGEFMTTARAWDEVSYTPKQAGQAVLRQDNFGPWHDARYPTKLPGETNEEAAARHAEEGKKR